MLWSIEVPAASSSSIHGWPSTKPFVSTTPCISTCPHSLIVLVPHFCHTLTEIYLDTSIVNESTIHFEISFHALFLGGEFDKGILQGGARIGVADNFNLDIGIEPRKYQLQVFIFCNWIQFAHKQDFLWCLNV
jgi:hypothetical protein